MKWTKCAIRFLRISRPGVRVPSIAPRKIPRLTVENTVQIVGFLVLQCLSKGRFARYLRAIFQKTVILKLGLLIFEQAFFLLHRSRRGQSLARAAVFPFPVQRCASLCDIKEQPTSPAESPLVSCFALCVVLFLNSVKHTFQCVRCRCIRALNHTCVNV